MKKWSAVIIAGLVLAGCSAGPSAGVAGAGTGRDLAVIGNSGAMNAEGGVQVSASAQTGTDRAALLASIFPDNVTVTVDGGSMVVTIHTDSLPNHETGQFPNANNPNSVLPQNLAFRIPLNPQIASQTTPTNMGPIGVSVSGAVFYNPNNAQGQDATLVEVLDQCSGHPDPRGIYHYHEFSECVLQDAPGQHSRIFGIALDGFLVYGLQGVGGTAPSDLDACNGHTGPTPDNPAGEYHYHVTAEYPYIIGCYAGVVSATGGGQAGGGGQTGGQPAGGPPGGGQPGGGRRGGNRP